MTKMLLYTLLLVRQRRRHRKRKHRFWIRDIWKVRRAKGEFNLCAEMYEKDSESFRTYFRMSQHQFDYLVSRLAPSLQKCEEGRSPIDVRQRLAVTLRYKL